MEILDQHGNVVAGQPDVHPDHYQRFAAMGKLLYHDPEQDFTIRAGVIWWARTVKDEWTYIIPMRIIDGWLLYVQGDRALKVKVEEFVRAAMWGKDLKPVKPEEVDAERIPPATVYLDAIANRRSLEEQIDLMGEGAEERFRQGVR